MSKDLSWSDVIIRDGFTQRAYIAAVEGLHGALRFSFRPMIPEKVERIEHLRDKENAREPDKARVRVAEVLAEQLTAWDAKIGDQPAPISTDSLRRMRISQQMKVYNIVCGFGATDIDPEWLEEDDLPPLNPMSENLVESVEERLGNS